MLGYHPFYVIWTGALNLGDTPGVFTDSAFVGLSLQLPITISPYQEEQPAPDPLRILLLTSDVEIFGGQTHAVYWDWQPGDPLSAPIGYIDDTDQIPGRREYHLLSVPQAAATAGRHTITILVNADVATGMRDDFVLKRIEMMDTVGAKIGW